MIAERAKEFVKCHNNFKYFINNYMFTDSNSESLSYLIWLILFKSNLSIGFLTKSMKNGEELINTLCRYIDNFPNWIKPKFIRKTKTGFVLESKTKFFIMNQAKDIKNRTLSYLVVDGLNISNKMKKIIIPAMAKEIKKENINKHIIYLI